MDTRAMLVVAFCAIGCLCTVNGRLLKTSTTDMEIVIGNEAQFKIEPLESLVGKVERIDLLYKHKDILNVTPSSIHVANSSGFNPWPILVHGISPGHDIIHLVTKPAPKDKSDDIFIRVTVEKSSELTLTSVIVGWVYFAAWSVSFYPQVYENWKRKSVVGLNFDFLTLNIIGFVLYSIFNCGLYWIPEVEEDYFSRHPGGLNPVQLNDIVFAVHATIVTLFTIGQCLCYERGDQSVSLIAKIIVVIFAIVVIVTSILSGVKVMQWLDFLYACSYIKLTITLIKYIPQAYMNYKRKSTIGWSIGNVVLDFTGGILSMLQMIINADNYNDWASIFGDPTKFGLGLFSVLFDIFFLIQHYILYRVPRYESVEGETQPGDPVRPSSSKNLDSDYESDPSVTDLYQVD